MIQQDSQCLIGICFMPPCEGKALGHATLIAGSHDRGFVTIDYDGVKTPLIIDARESELIGNLLLMPVSKKQLEDLLDYYHSINPSPLSQHFYYARGMKPSFKYLACGKTTTNCLHSIMTIANDEACIDISFIREVAGLSVHPEKTSIAFAKRALTFRNSNEFDCHDGMMKTGNHVHVTPILDSRDRPLACFIQMGRPDYYKIADVLNMEITNSGTGYNEGKVDHLVAQCKLPVMTLLQMENAWMSAIGRRVIRGIGSQLPTSHLPWPVPMLAAH